MVSKATLKAWLGRPRTRHGIALAGVLLVSVVLNFTSLRFPVGYHPDEARKGVFVIERRQDFKHPLLILQLTRVLARATAERDPDAAVLLGRLVSAAAGVGLVLVSYIFFRQSITAREAVLIAAATAVSPIVVVHAHYLKEDVLFTFLVWLSLWLYYRVLHTRHWLDVLWFGLSLGAALSSHYKALLLLPFFGVGPLLNPRLFKGVWVQHYLRLGGASMLAAIVFLAINWPLFVDPQVFLDGFSYEATHALSGHNVIISPWTYWYGFHFLYSLVPGLTLPAALIALAAVIGALGMWRRLTFVDRIVVSFVVLFYFVMEVSPLKPAPDFSRYVLPIVPGLFYLIWRVTSVVARGNPVGYLVVTAVSLAVVVFPMLDSARLVYYLDRDTRAQAWHWLEQQGLLGAAYFEAYAHPRVGEENTQSASTVVGRLDKLRAQDIEVVVTSSFQYDRYYLGAQLPHQSEAVYKGYQRYQELFSLPYQEISPTYRSYAFGNPTIRIVDIRLQP